MVDRLEIRRQALGALQSTGTIALALVAALWLATPAMAACGLSRDLFAIPPAEILETTVDLTMVSGEIEHDSR